MKTKIVHILLVIFSSMIFGLKAQNNSPSATDTKPPSPVYSLSSLPKIYHPKDNAKLKIAALVKKAQLENKNIILQAGGNWCVWCLRFNHFIQNTPEIKKILDKNYLYYHLNFSPENKNETVFKQYGNPGKKYGYPVFIVLDKNGKMIHVQESSVLEENAYYNVQKTKDFFEKWVPVAIEPEIRDSGLGYFDLKVGENLYLKNQKINITFINTKESSEPVGKQVFLELMSVTSRPQKVVLLLNKPQKNGSLGQFDFNGYQFYVTKFENNSNQSKLSFLVDKN